LGHVIGREGPPLEGISFGSGATGAPGFLDSPQTFTVESGKTKINPGMDAVLAGMRPGEKRSVVIPAAQAYGRAGFYAPDTPGKRRFVISPNTLLVYEIEASPNP
jgi:FKBP-type peptidyl-prolyl cis-trans isomerase